MAPRIQVRPGVGDDVQALCELDRLAQEGGQRRSTIQNAVAAGQCLVAEQDGRVVGYGILEYTFYGQGFVALLYVHPPHRRQRVGTALMRRLEASCRTPGSSPPRTGPTCPCRPCWPIGAPSWAASSTTWTRAIRSWCT